MKSRFLFRRHLKAMGITQAAFAVAVAVYAFAILSLILR